jgi:hypothetical protein
MKELNREAAVRYRETTVAEILSNFLKLVDQLPQPMATLLYQLVAGHAPLQQHLRRLKAAPPPTMPYKHCGRAPETTQRFILRRPHFAASRYLYLGSLGRDFLPLQHLFLSPDPFPPFVRFH